MKKVYQYGIGNACADEHVQHFLCVFFKYVPTEFVNTILEAKLTNNEYFIELVVPGFDKSEITIEYASENNNITISSNSPTISNFVKSFWFFHKVDVSKGMVTLKNGVLTIVVPRIHSKTKIIKMEID